MMFKASYSIDAGTTKADPDRKKLTVAKGTIIQWETWCHQLGADLLHWRIEYHNLQILPFSGSEWMDKIHRPFPMPEEIEINDSPYVLDIFAYNEDTEKAHAYTIQVHIKPDKPIKLEATVSQQVVEAYESIFGGE